jgi:hypothetical protein
MDHLRSLFSMGLLSVTILATQVFFPLFTWQLTAPTSPSGTDCVFVWTGPTQNDVQRVRTLGCDPSTSELPSDLTHAAATIGSPLPPSSRRDYSSIGPYSHICKWVQLWKVQAFCPSPRILLVDYSGDSAYTHH